MAKRKTIRSTENVKKLTTRQLWFRVRGKGGPFKHTVLYTGVGLIDTRTGKKVKVGDKYFNELMDRLEKKGKK